MGGRGLRSLHGTVPPPCDKAVTQSLPCRLSPRCCEAHSRPVHRFQCSWPTVSSSFTPSSMALVNFPTASHFCSLWAKHRKAGHGFSYQVSSVRRKRRKTHVVGETHGQHNHRGCFLAGNSCPLTKLVLKTGLIQVFKELLKNVSFIFYCFLSPSIPCEFLNKSILKVNKILIY